MAPPLDGRNLHFVGIGGAGMSGLALVALALGAAVTGSDREDSPVLERLRAAGIAAQPGHDASHLPAGAAVIVSTAIPADNPEVAAARAAGAEILHRADLLGEISRLKRSIAISGTHGKTTTTGMVVEILSTTGRDPAFLVGGDLRGQGTNAAWGGGDWIVVEADESDRSFLKLSRDVAVVTNVELDHHATYRSLRNLEAAFAEFTAPAELRVLGPGVDLAGEGERVSYDIGAGDLRAEALELLPLGSRFEVEGARVELRVPGRHNVLNALAALAACRAAGVPVAEAAPALAGFSGAGRRFEDRGKTAVGARVFDDYAHHPTEVRATLEAARTLDAARLIACFQPHLYSRTRELAPEFGRALALADVAAVVDVYPARERAEDFPGVSGLTVARAVAEAAPGKPVWWVPALAEAERLLSERLRAGDVLLTLGAGDVDGLATRLTAENPA
jgi:UDP-N-acetylmuramate--alanine ligase